MSRLFTAILAACLVSISAPPLHAEWLANGTAITRNAQLDNFPKIIHDGAGGVWITWSIEGVEDDIVIQNIDSEGNLRWSKYGVDVCTEFDQQIFPQMVSDGSGGVIIAWWDFRNMYGDIYAQRIDASGSDLWTYNGVAICTETDEQREPKIISDGDGGAVIVWGDFRNASDYDIYAQRIDSLGATQWTDNGVAICTATDHQLYSKVVTDGSGGAIIVWEDSRSDNDIYAQRVNREGVVQWTANGVAICAVASIQDGAWIVSDGAGGAVITWRDWRNGNSDIYAQRVNGSGVAQWTGNGVPVCMTTGQQMTPYAVSDGAAGAIIAYQDSRSGTYDIYAQRINAGGTVEWGADGIEINTKPDNQYLSQLTPDGAGGAVIVWSDWRTGDDSDIYAQRVDGSGNIQWESNGIVICTEANSQAPQIASVNADTVIIVWRDRRMGGNDFYAQKRNGDGRVSSLTPTITAVDDIPGDQGGWARIRIDAPDNDSDEVPYYPTTMYNVWRKIGSPTLLMLKSESDAVFETDTDVLLRSILDPGCAEGKIITREQAPLLGLPPGEWESIGIHPATQEPYYYFLVPTNNDSTGSGIPWQTYVVTAHTIEPRLFFASDPDSGYSVDNLAPAQPQGFAGMQSLAPQGLRLSWQPNTERDLDHYEIHRGDSELFIPDEVNRIGTTADTVLIDTAWAPTDYYFYKLSAVDVHDNRGADVLLRPEDIEVGTLLQGHAAHYDGSALVVMWTLIEAGEDMIFYIAKAQSGSGDFREIVEPPLARENLTFCLRDTDYEPGETYRYRVEVEDDERRRFLFETGTISVPALPLTLYQNHPNPFNPSTTIRYYVPARALVTLDIYDITGKRIARLVDSERDKGFHHVEWQGIDESGNKAASGVYLYRLQSGKDTISKKLVLLR